MAVRNIDQILSTVTGHTLPPNECDPFAFNAESVFAQAYAC